MIWYSKRQEILLSKSLWMDANNLLIILLFMLITNLKLVLNKSLSLKLTMSLIKLLEFSVAFMEEMFSLLRTPLSWQLDFWTKLQLMMKLSSPWWENSKLNVDTTLFLKSRQCLKILLNLLRWWMISKIDQETLEPQSKESNLLLISSQVDIGHSKKFQSVRFQLNLREFRMFSMVSTNKSFLIDKLTTFSRMVLSWFKLNTLKKSTCLTCHFIKGQFALCLTIMKSWLIAKFKQNSDLAIPTWKKVWWSFVTQKLVL